MKVKSNKRNLIIIIFLTFFILLFFIFSLCKNQNNDIKISKKIKNKIVTEKQTAIPTPEPTLSIVKIKKTIKKGKLLQEHTVYHSSNYNRDNNLRVAAKMLSNTVILPGGEFSFFGIIGNPNAKKGFKEAGVIINHKPARALAGGICEVATSLNTVVVNAGIKTNAQNHSINVGYLNSTDHEATVAYYGGIDLKFTNTLKYPIMIKQSVSGGNVTSKIFKVNILEKIYLRNSATGNITKGNYKIKKLLSKRIIGNNKNKKFLKIENFLLNPNDFFEKKKPKKSKNIKKPKNVIKSLIEASIKANIEIDKENNYEALTIKNTKKYPVLIRVSSNAKTVQTEILKLKKLD